MNIETTTSKLNNSHTQTSSKSTQANSSDNVNFSDELKNLKSQAKESEKNKKSDEKISDKKTNEAIDGLQNAVDEINKINRSDENDAKNLKQKYKIDDKYKEVKGLIDNNMNVQEPLDRLMPEMNTGMNFNSDEKSFSEFVKNDKNSNLKLSSKELEEESKILSTMEENIAIANRNIALNIKTVTNEEGIKKVDRNTNITVDTIVKFDSVSVSKEDAEFFINLIENGGMNIHDAERAEASSKVSKTLADLLAKSMNENKPVRIDFDNNISVIIRISRDGKLSADFLPSSQVAEAYLKENLPLLKQRFDDNNIEYDELNQRKQKQENSNENRKKGRKDE